MPLEISNDAYALGWLWAVSSMVYYLFKGWRWYQYKRAVKALERGCPRAPAGM